MNAGVERVNPDGLHSHPAFTNVVTVAGPARTIYVGGQNATTADGEIVGRGDMGLQAEQVFRNLETALGGAGAALDDVIKWTIYVVEGQPLEPAFEVFQRIWNRQVAPPLITLAVVSALARPDALLELEAVAVVPE